ncbi:MAG: GGDEF domain-containing protein [Lachnospiraceae bacterium]|nr:GGDEF domain-containing protein [Lachnospiraceae bacterium]
MNEAISYAYAYPICALLFLLLLLLHFFSKRQLPVLRNRMFTAAILLACADAIFEVFAVMVVRHASAVPNGLGSIVLVIYMLLRLSMPTMMILHTLSATQSLKMRNFWEIAIMMIPSVITVGIILCTPLTGHVFFLKDGVYYCGILYHSVCAVSTIASLVCVVYAVIKRKKLTSVQFVAIAAFAILLSAGSVLEISMPDKNVSSVAVAACMVVAYLLLPKPETMIDHMTGLLNLDAMMMYIDELISREAKYYVLVLKAENIRRINSIFGYTIGSLTLQNVADLLSYFSPDLRERSRARRSEADEISDPHKHESGDDCKTDTEASRRSEAGDARKLERNLPPAWAFRLMSNQFAIVSTSLRTQETILAFLQKRFENSWMIRGLELSLMLTVAEIPDTGSFGSGKDLYKVIEMILPSVPKGDVVTISERELARIERNVILENSLEKALAQDALDVRFQPIFSTSTGRYSHAEALVRFSHPDYGDISPSEFIPIAEKRGLVAQIDEFVLRKTCEWIKQAEKEGVVPDFVSVNISATEMAGSAFPSKVNAILEEYGVSRSRIVFEISEAALMTSLVLMLQNFSFMAMLGYGFAIDNVGLGNGDFEKLSILPVSVVKLDRSVIEQVETSPRSRILFENTIDVLRKMEIRSIVVGAESSAQADWIESCRPDHVQGFYYARPMDGATALAFFKRKNEQEPRKTGRDGIIVVTE